MSTVRELQQSGELYPAKGDPTMVAELHHCQEEIFEVNNMHPRDWQARNERIAHLLGRAGRNLHVNAPLFLDFGYNVEVGDDFFANFNLTILDETKVTFGNHVYIGPNCSFYTAGHPLDQQLRDADYEYALPIHVGNSVWFGGGVTVVPGVTIGNNVVVGAGSVVTHDVPDNVVVAGNPARIIKKL